MTKRNLSSTIALIALLASVLINLPASAQPGPRPGAPSEPGWRSGMMLGPGMMGGRNMGFMCHPRTAGMAEWSLNKIEPDYPGVSAIPP